MAQSSFPQATFPEDFLAPMPRAMLVFAHPDDETVALGARLGRFASAFFVHVTDGAPRNEQDSRAKGFADLDDYRRAREAELCRVLALAGLGNARRERLGIPDQEASLCLPWLANRLKQLLAEQRPEVVFTHPYEGGHPDHDACAFAVHRARALLRERGEPAPAIIEAGFYHAGPDGVEAGCFLPATEKTAETVYPLTEEERQRKRARLACFITQRETLSNFPLADERYRIAPKYDFAQPPHAGPVLYDQFPWGMTSERFCELARAAEAATEEAAAWPCR
jgi:LmbE family N-acetylglucosaminyl deacetylase